MEITKKSLVLLVKAARTAADLNRNVHALVNEASENETDWLYGWIFDALISMSREHLGPELDVEESITMKLIKSNLDDGTVAELIMALAESRKPLTPTLEGERYL